MIISTLYAHLVGVLRVGEEVRLPELRVERAQDVVEDLPDVRVVVGQADALGRVLGQHLVEERLLDSEGAAGRHDGDRARHRRLALLLLQRVGDHEEGAKADGHPLRSVDDL